DVAVVGGAKVALVIAFDLAGDGHIFRDIRPFELEAHTGLPCLHMEFGVVSWAGVGAHETRNRKIVSTGRTGVIIRGGLDEAIGRHSDRTQLQGARQTFLNWRVKRKYPHRRDGRNYVRSFGLFRCSSLPRARSGETGILRGSGF